MTLTAARKTQQRVSPFGMYWQFLVATAETIFHGSMVELFGGVWYPAGTNGVGARVIGRASASDGISAAAGERLRVDTGIYGWDNSDAIVAADIGKMCYAVDDESV